jgi:hypothetical protein
LVYKKSKTWPKDATLLDKLKDLRITDSMHRFGLGTRQKWTQIDLRLPNMPQR